VADRYSNLLAGSGVGLPFVPDLIEPVWHLYVIRSKQRDALKAHLDQQGVSTVIHYPIPPHRQACYQGFRRHKLPIAELLAGEVLSLPVSSALKAEEVAYVAESVVGFRKSARQS
jgi:dTDP-4-amino-4,6-dideoxygalactose transaminase